ncbi:uncharacterized protein LOC133806941 [Humulus lupulus]|uniref:uncharacterized protein LOC133806941 n=1 Tax=Humulus lupulus TaxID=3486 RepID=UPI002B409370|nr:uncharacterized protein LOC133806941 [Humulus lupulus]
MPSSRKHNDMQSLTGRITALSHFVSKATDKCTPFFNTLQGGQMFEWTEECEQTFQQLKAHMVNPPILSKPTDREPLLLYMDISENAISVALVCEEGRVQHPIYYVSKRLLGGESRTAIKGQALADFIVEYIGTHERPEEAQVVGLVWKLFMDGSSNKNGAEAGLILVSLDGHRVHSTLRFGFDASNNEVEYEALIARLRVALELKAECLDIFSDSQLVVNQAHETKVVAI